MLPDFPDVKKHISESRSAQVSAGQFGDPVLAKVRTYRQHEGDQFTIIREDGTSSTSRQREIRSEAMEFRLPEIQTRGEVAIFETVYKAFGQVHVASRRLFSERINEEPINRVDGKGRQFTSEVYLEILESLEMSFDEQGNWNEPDFWQERPNPATLRTVEAVRKRVDEDPELKSRLDALIDRKREAFNDREANRKLVD